ncbi:MAG TPA: (2Fe-2S)-binding protein [Noviherbaspirillum sp.]|nr:(2Fe-2S)-binding protein [Noviherbaspirillum sp.]
MIICVCHNVSETSIRRAVDSGATSMPQLREQLSVGTCCGKCNSCAKTILRECLEVGVRDEQPGIFQTAIAA